MTTKRARYLFILMLLAGCERFEEMHRKRNEEVRLACERGDTFRLNRDQAISCIAYLEARKK